MEQSKWRKGKVLTDTPCSGRVVPAMFAFSRLELAGSISFSVKTSFFCHSSNLFLSSTLFSRPPWLWIFYHYTSIFKKSPSLLPRHSCIARVASRHGQLPYRYASHLRVTSIICPPPHWMLSRICIESSYDWYSNQFFLMVHVLIY